jgi:hypothetical protein
MIKGRHLTDDRHDGIGIAGDINGDVRKVLDLPNHVVAEVADDPTVQRREFVELWRPIALEEPLDGGEYAAIAGHLGRNVSVHLEQAVTQHEGGVGIAADERPTTPTLAMFH